VSHSREQIALPPLQLPIPWMRRYRGKGCHNLFYFWIPPTHPSIGCKRLVVFARNDWANV
jgi:hypothetical protein